MLDAGKAFQINTNLADDFQRSAGIDARNARQVHAAGLKQERSRVKPTEFLAGVPA